MEFKSVVKKFIGESGQCHRCLAIAALTLNLAVSACGDRAKEDLNVSKIEMNTSRLDNLTYLNMSAEVKVGKMKFPELEVPIINPQTLKSFGQLALTRTPEGVNKIFVSVDLFASTRLDPTLGFSLPNQREIPLALGATDVALIGIPILRHSRVYIGGDIRKDLFLGAAIVIPALDPILNQVQIPLNAFLSFPLGTKVLGVGGLFTSPMPDQNGLAVFIKRSANGVASSVMASHASATSFRSVDGTVTAATDNELYQMDTKTTRRLNRWMNRSATIQVR